MTDTSNRRERESLSGLWPWPGNIFLILIACWLFYMGAIATVADVKTAFYGLGAVALVVLLFGLRSAFVQAPKRHGGRQATRAGVAQARRSTIASDAMGVDATMRTSEAAAPRQRTPMEDEDAPARSGERPIYPAEVTTRVVPARRDEITPQATDLEAWMNREKAERGAQFVKLDQTLTALTHRLAALEHTSDEEDEDDDRGMGSKVDALAARVDAMERNGAPPRPGTLDPYLRINAFNEAVNERLVPRMQQMILNALNERLSPDALRSALGIGDGEGTQDGTLLTAQLGQMRQSLSAANDTAREERTVLHNEVRAARELAEAAMRAVSAAPAGDADPAAETPGLAAEFAALRSGSEREIADLRAAVDALGARPDGTAGAVADPGLSGRVEAAETMLGEIRGSLDAVTQHLSRVGDQYGDLVARIDRIGAGDRPAEGSPAQSDVAALRDALTTIIDQTREIRAQQQLLSARFDTPTRVEVDTGEP